MRLVCEPVTEPRRGGNAVPGQTREGSVECRPFAFDGRDKLFCGMRWSRGFWFRVSGYGIHVKLVDGHEPLFSERYGYRKAYYVCGLRIAFLGRDKT